MKKFIILILSTLLVSSFVVACGGGGDSSSSDEGGSLSSSDEGDSLSSSDEGDSLSSSDEGGSLSSSDEGDSSSSSDEGDSSSSTTTEVEVPSVQISSDQDALGAILAVEKIDFSDPMIVGWIVTYRSVSVAGDPIEVTGTIVAPNSVATEPRPVLSIGHSTLGVADMCAPSLDYVGDDIVLTGRAALTQPLLDDGSVKVRGRTSLLAGVSVGLNPNLTGYENVHLYGSILGHDKETMEGMIDDILDFLSGIAHSLVGNVKIGNVLNTVFWSFLYFVVFELRDKLWVLHDLVQE